MDFLIVTGMSGAGKSNAMKALEDLDYFCVDNVPPQLLTKFIELNISSYGYSGKMALCVDTRSREAFGDFSKELDKIRDSGVPLRILFLDASDETLINRYKENRRKHPLIIGDVQNLEDAILKERSILEPIKNIADFTVVTSRTSDKQLTKSIIDLFSKEDSNRLVVQFMSFGFKYGVPLEVDMVQDIRFLPNPFYIPELKEKTGLDHEIEDYLMGFEDTVSFREKFTEFVDYLYPLYKKEGRLRWVIAIGCTGGKHRSVAMVEWLAKHLEQQDIPVVKIHRDKNK